MEEKVLIKAEFSGVKFLIGLIWFLALAPALLLVLIGVVESDEELIPVGILIGVVMAIFAFLFAKILKARELIVTNKRVIARAAFGHRVDLPIEKVTGVSTCFFGGIGCSSPSARVKFHFVKNKMDVFNTIAAEVLQRDSKYQ